MESSPLVRIFGLLISHDFFGIEVLSELSLVELDLLKAAAREEEEGDDAKDRKAKTRELPVPGVAPVAVVDVALNREKQKEPEAERDEELGTEAEVENEVGNDGQLPAANSLLLQNDMCRACEKIIAFDQQIILGLTSGAGMGEAYGLP